jgi:4-hydroxy-4-methyl-2-oxoglutarate aldolase
VKNGLTAAQLEQLHGIDTCTVSNVIETFGVRVRDEGFADSSVRSIFPHFPPMVGYAVTGTIRTAVTPTVVHGYYDRTDWWNHLLTVPEPRVIVVQDIDKEPGLGAFLGEVHANILRALGCVGAVTNGAVRDLPAVEAIGFQLFAGHVAVSHAYAHIVEFGSTVEVGGLTVRPGDLIHGDRHGILSIPLQIAAEIPSVAARIVETEKRIVSLCQSPQFSLEKLRTLLKELTEPERK